MQILDAFESTRVSNACDVYQQQQNKTGTLTLMGSKPQTSAAIAVFIAIQRVQLLARMEAKGASLYPSSSNDPIVENEKALWDKLATIASLEVYFFEILVC